MASSSCFELFPCQLRVTGGRLRVGLVCRGRRGDLVMTGIPGEYEEIEVGVDVRLNAPGDSDLRVVDEPLLFAKLGANGGKSCGVGVLGARYAL